MDAPSGQVRRWLAGAVLLCAALSLSACANRGSPASTAPKVGQAVGMPSPFLGANLSSISCGAPTLCAAVGAPFDPSPGGPVLTVSTDAGRHWGISSSPAPATTNFSDVACSEQSCLALGTTGSKLLLLGSSFAKAFEITTTPVTSGNPQAVACAQRSWCLAFVATPTGVVASSTNNAGRAWSQAVGLPSGVGEVLSASCSSTATCITAGIDPNGNPQVLLKARNSGGWQLATLPAGTTSVLSASCTTDLRCFLVVHNPASPTNQILASTHASTTFQVAASFAILVHNPTAISCAATTCVVAGSDNLGAGALSSRTGSAPERSIAVHYVPTAFLGVSCASPAQCVGATTSSLVRITPSVQAITTKPARRASLGR